MVGTELARSIACLGCVAVVSGCGEGSHSARDVPPQAFDYGWTRTWGGPRGDVAAHVVSYAGGVVVSGSTPVGTSLGLRESWEGNVGPGFVARFDGRGALLWGQRFGTANGLIGALPTLLAHSSGMLLVGELGVELPAGAGFGSALVTFSPGGSMGWQVTWKDAANIVAPVMAELDDGSIALLSRHLPADGPSDDDPHRLGYARLRTFTPSGALLSDVTVPNLSEAAIAGGPSGSLFVSWASPSSSTESRACLARMTRDGALVWNHCWGGPGLSSFSPGLLAFLAGGRLAAANTWYVGSGPQDSSAAPEVPAAPVPAGTDFNESFVGVALFEADGTFVTQSSVGAARKASVVALSPAPDGSFYVGGTFAGTSADLGATIDSYGSDPFVAHFDDAGTYLGARTFGAHAAELLSDIATLEDGDIVAAGSFEGTLDFAADDYETDVHAATPDSEYADAFLTRFTFEPGSQVSAPTPAHCSTFAGAPVPADYDACVAAGFQTSVSPSGPTCYAIWHSDDPAAVPCTELGIETTRIADSPDPNELTCCIRYPAYDCPVAPGCF